MTPLAGFFKRILGAGAPTPAAAEPPAPRGRSRATAPDDSAPPPDDGERSGRRRGTRGGRGRGGSSDAAQAAPPAAEARESTSTSTRGGRGRGRGSASNSPEGTGASSEPRSYSWTARSAGTDRNETEEQARQRREQASRQRRGRTPSFRPYRENLDAPLPEDIAFRSAAEGGDRSILPARRRRGTGLRDTERVLVAGARSLSGWSRPIGGSDDLTVASLQTDTPEGTTAAPARRSRPARVSDPAIVLDGDDDTLEATAEDGETDETETTEDGAPRRRRRGRRGGRGRRRPGTPLEGELDENGEPRADLVDARTEDDLPDEEFAEDELAEDLADELGDEGAEEPLEETVDDGVAIPRAVAIAAVLSGEADDEAGAQEDADDLDNEEDDEEESSYAAYDLSDADEFEEPEADLDASEDHDDAPEADDEREAAPSGPVRREARKPRAQATVEPADLPQAFADLGVGEITLQTLARWRFDKPTPIQERAIPALIGGRDVVGVAQTGSGKTVAFGIPMVECLDPELAEVQGLVLVPTRELASQVLDVLKDLAAGFGLEAVGILGGHSLAGDFKALERRPAIVVGTPGRVIDHLQRGTLSLRYVRYAVLDEADQMLDIGFLPDIRRILSRTPKRRQTALFSATMPSTIRRLVWQFMENPETVTVDPELSTVDTIDQVYFEVATRDKARGLRELVERELKGRTLVFCKMKRGVDRLEADLARQGVRVGALHGDMDQRRRERVVQEFRAGELDVLIATNVAARGLDIPEITHVVNYDVPQNPEEYVHRIGRTGRAGRDGKAITFVSEWDMREWDAIEQAFGDQLRREELEIYS